MVNRFKFFLLLPLVLLVSTSSCSRPLRMDPGYRMRSWEPSEGKASYPLEEPPPVVEAPLEALTIARAREMALANNETVAAARATVEEARARILEAFSPFLPTISGDINRTSNREFSKVTIAGGGSFVVSPPFITQGSAALNLSLFAFGRDKAGVDAARAELDVEFLNERTAKQTILLETTEAWYRIQNAKSQLQVAKDSESAAARQHADAKNVYAAGRSAKDQVLIANVNWLESKQEVLSAENTMQHQNRVLNVLLTRPVDAPLTLADPPEYQKTVINGDQLVAWAQRYNPFVTAFRASRHALEKRRESVALSLTPELYTTLGATYSDFRGFSGHSTNYFATLGLQFTPVDGGRRMSRLGQIHAQLVRLTYQEQQALRQLNLDIRKVLLDIIEAESQVETARAAIESSTESYRIISDRFRNGKTTSREVLEAQASLSNSRNAHNLGRFGRQVLLAQLEALVGVQTSEWLEVAP